jgi:nitrite reductase/ring-hydroxylating ferredoxin subunit
MNKWQEQRHASASGTLLCKTLDIGAGQVKEFRFGGDSPFAFRLFIYNDQGKYIAYRNACPHYDVPLNHIPGKIFTSDNQFFLCMTHYARFDKGSGLCIDGPCVGDSLEKIPLRQDADSLLIGDVEGI